MATSYILAAVRSLGKLILVRALLPRTMIERRRGGSQSEMTKRRADSRAKKLVPVPSRHRGGTRPPGPATAWTHALTRQPHLCATASTTTVNQRVKPQRGNATAVERATRTKRESPATGTSREERWIGESIHETKISYDRQFIFDRDSSLRTWFSSIVFFLITTLLKLLRTMHRVMLNNAIS